VVPVGSTHGTCGGSSSGPPDSGTGGGNCVVYGQICTQTGQCCSGVPCTGGRCRYP
jgi:hypothetical protein